MQICRIEKGNNVQQTAQGQIDTAHSMRKAGWRKNDTLITIISSKCADQDRKKTVSSSLDVLRHMLICTKYPYRTWHCMLVLCFLCCSTRHRLHGLVSCEGYCRLADDIALPINIQTHHMSVCVCAVHHISIDPFFSQQINKKNTTNIRSLEHEDNENHRANDQAKNWLCISYIGFLPYSV